MHIQKLAYMRFQKQNFIYSNIIYCIINTVCFQTEFTSQAYKLKFLEPVVLLAVTHGSWWLLWPIQIILCHFGERH